MIKMKRKIILLYFFITGLVILGMTDNRALKVKDFSSEKRVALVIGNSKYKYNALKNPENDAEDISKELNKLGFEVILRKNLDKRGMVKAVREFGKKIRNGGVGLFYFAGHGVQVKGVNYLIPLNEEIQTEEDVEFEAIEARRVLAEMKKAGNKMNIIILDACRNNPFESANRSGTRGLARMDAPTGSLLVYSTSPGKTALDGENSRNGVFTESFLKELKLNPAVNINDLLINVRTRVITKTDNKQIPWESSSLTGKFYFTRSTKDEYESFRKDQTTGLKEFEIKQSNLKNVIKKRAEYRLKMDEEYRSIESMEGDNFITPEEKIILWNEFLNNFSDNNTYKVKVKEKIEYWENEKSKSVKSKAVKKKFVKKSLENISFEEYFADNRNNWNEVNTTDKKLKVEGDGYRIYNKNSFQKSFKTNILDDTRDFEIEASITKISGRNNNGMNILFGGNSSGTKYFVYGTTGTGYYGIYKYDNGWKEIIPWKTSSYINKNEATNNLKIKKEGNTLYFYINGNYVNKVEDYEWFGKTVGFAVNPNIEVKIRSLTVTHEKNFFEDYFVDNKNDWSELNTTDKKLKIEGDGYRIYNKKYFQKVWKKDLAGQNEDYEIRTTISKLSGRNNNGMNILFGGNSSGTKYFVYGITGTGYYGIYKYDNGWKEIIPWKTSGYINKDESTNDLKIEKKGTILYFYINGNYVNKINNFEGYGASVGFAVNPDIEIKARNLIIRKKSGDIVLEDNFRNNNNNWLEVSSERKTLAVKNNGYTIYNKDYFQKAWLNNIIKNNVNIEIDAEFQKISGVNNNAMNIMFGSDKDGKNYFTFGISGDGQYLVSKYTGNWTNLINWTQSSFINKGNSKNNLKIIKNGDTFYFYINEKYVNKIKTTSWYGAGIGFAINTNIQTKITKIKVKTYNEPVYIDLPYEISLLEDEFNDNKNNWFEKDTEAIKLKIKSGGYNIYSKDKYYKTWQNNLFSNSNEDFDIKSTIRKNSGKENNIYGILFGMDSGGNKYYTFGVSANGYYTLLRYDNGWKSEIAWKASKYINKNNGQNTFRVKKTGKTLYLYINGKYIDKITNYNAYGRSIGIGVASDIDITVKNYFIKKINIE